MQWNPEGHFYEPTEVQKELVAVESTEAGKCLTK